MPQQVYYTGQAGASNVSPVYLGSGEAKVMADTAQVIPQPIGQTNAFVTHQNVP